MATSPYVGLRPYEETDSAYFFGRQGELSVLYDAYQEQAADKGKLLIIYGPSSVGKTSIVQAGLWPHVKASGDATRIERLVPYFDEDIQAFSQRIRQSVGRLSGASKDRPLVFIDEIDQVFGFPLDGELDAETRSVLMKLLEFLAQASRRSIARIIFAVREPWSRFLEDAPRSLAFLESSMDFFRLGFMSSSGMEEFLRRPLQRFQELERKTTLVDSSIFEEFFGELSGNPAALPLANLMLEKIVLNGRPDQVFSYNHYLEGGGLIGFAVEHAEKIYQGWEPELQSKVPIFMEMFRAAGIEHSQFGVRTSEVKPLMADPDCREVFGHLMHERLLCLKGDRWEVAETQVTHDQVLEVWERTALPESERQGHHEGEEHYDGFEDDGAREIA